jgi:spermidine dehydrogenase
LVFAKDNYGFQIWADSAPSFGYFFDDVSSPGRGWWMYDMWGRDLEGTPFPPKLKRDLLTWRTSQKRYYDGNDVGRWLDSMSYKDYIEKVMGLDPGVTRYADPILAAAVGLGCDVTSAYTAQEIQMPGFAFTRKGSPSHSEYHSFPGGNTCIARYFVKALLPNAIRGSGTFEDVLNGRVEFDALDRPENPVRIRLGSTAVRVEHDGSPERSEQEDYRLAYQQFHRSPMLVVNVALTNWRFLYKLGLTACRWFDGFGFCCNIRQPMIVSDYRPPLDPERPTILTFYVPFYYPGKPIHEQGVQGRNELFSTSYADYERQIREQMIRLFGGAGFNPRKDIAGIILNRWGHAYVDPQPGFYFGRDGAPAPRDILRKRYGRIGFAHSEMNGHQNWSGAAMEGRHAMGQLLEVI